MGSENLSDWVDAQDGESICCAYMSFCWFSYDPDYYHYPKAERFCQGLIKFGFILKDRIR